jgi:RNA polymerase sigma-70 factor (ECF subfamily)
MADDARTDAELLAATARDPEAFGIFYRRHVDWVLGYLGRRVDSPEVAADLAAESFAAALISLPRFDPLRGQPAAWLFGIVVHHLARHRRRGGVEARARRRLGIGALPAVEDGLVERLAGDAEAMLAALPPDQRDAVRERILEDRGYGEIAVSFGVSEPVVRQRVSRGLRTLRRRLKTEER